MFGCFFNHKYEEKVITQGTININKGSGWYDAKCYIIEIKCKRCGETKYEQRLEDGYIISKDSAIIKKILEDNL